MVHSQRVRPRGIQNIFERNNLAEENSGFVFILGNRGAVQVDAGEEPRVRE